MKKIFFTLALCFHFSVYAETQFKPMIFGGYDVSATDPIAKSTAFLKGKFLHASFTCTRTLIAPDLVVTAGHCLG
ncbi:MAG: hypothetical protein H7326_10425 [Bdellovibrionaceae bacterium]|nr:hypothetical protein [Pseudobdellovibrionaceae bacterium]